MSAPLYIDHLTSDLFFGNNRMIPEKPGLQNDIACSDCIALWGARRKKSKMANELELAEEMSNSSPEQAMELFSSIGNTLSEFWYQIFILFHQKLFFFFDACAPKLTSFLFFWSMTSLVKRDISNNDEEGIKMKEQAILSLGKLLSKHGKAEGKVKQSSSWEHFF